MKVLERRGLTRHYALFDGLKAAHMSGDEPMDDDEKQRLGLDNTQPSRRLFVVIEGEWESSEWKRFMRSLDAMNLEDKAHADPGGNQSRVRIDSSTCRIAKNRPVPKGLWRNCYNQAWLAKQKPHFIDSLNVRDMDYDFSLTP
ncbi:hypothetical protein BV20DRAFT_952825 [Pilatotrama ljubarskyi]|nr:hypothetical protein BV20DRAFT_952825 [Pilatotrama ljubarskyi]